MISTLQEQIFGFKIPQTGPSRDWKETEKRKKQGNFYRTVSLSPIRKGAMMINRSNFNLKVHSILNNTDGTIEMDFHLIVPSYFGYGTMQLFGNYLIVYIIRTNTSMKTAINYLVFNQACADILITSLYLVDTVRAYSNHGL